MFLKIQITYSSVFSIWQGINMRRFIRKFCVIDPPQHTLRCLRAQDVHHDAKNSLVDQTKEQKETDPLGRAQHSFLHCQV